MGMEGDEILRFHGNKHERRNGPLLAKWFIPQIYSADGREMCCAFECQLEAPREHADLVFVRARYSDDERIIRLSDVINELTPEFQRVAARQVKRRSAAEWLDSNAFDQEICKAIGESMNSRATTHGWIATAPNEVYVAAAGTQQAVNLAKLYEFRAPPAKVELKPQKAERRGHLSHWITGGVIAAVVAMIVVTTWPSRRGEVVAVEPLVEVPLPTSPPQPTLPAQTSPAQPGPPVAVNPDVARPAASADAPPPSPIKKLSDNPPAASIEPAQRELPGPNDIVAGADIKRLKRDLAGREFVVTGTLNYDPAKTMYDSAARIELLTDDQACRIVFHPNTCPRDLADALRQRRLVAGQSLVMHVTADVFPADGECIVHVLSWQKR